jgi:hypothetical protein
MNKGLGVATALFAMMLFAPTGTHAGQVVIPVTQVGVEDTRTGQARVVVHVDLTDLAGFAVERARLVGEVTEAIPVEIPVWATAIAPGGTDMPQVRSLTSIRPDAGALTCDVTAILFGAADGSPVEQIAVSLPKWQGEDLPRTIAVALQESLAGAHLLLEGHEPYWPERRRSD